MASTCRSNYACSPPSAVKLSREWPEWGNSGQSSCLGDLPGDNVALSLYHLQAPTYLMSAHRSPARKAGFSVLGGGARRAPAIGTEEQIAEGTPQQIGDPALCQVVRSIVDHVTALAQAPEIALSVVARIVVEVGSSQDHAGLTRLRHLHEVGPAGGPDCSVRD
jgi:hypothetical protein